VSVIKMPFGEQNPTLARAIILSRCRSTKIGSMVILAYAVVAYLRTFFLSHHKLALEAAALRQQLTVFKRKQPRPKLNRLDRLFWIVLRRLWSGWSEALIICEA
jgi:putative transposase